MVRFVGSETRRIENKGKKTDFMGVEKWEIKYGLKLNNIMFEIVTFSW